MARISGVNIPEAKRVEVALTYIFGIGVTTSRKILRMVRNAGAREVHLRISCPPTISPCYYGVDTPHRQDLIASQMTEQQITEYIGADSLGYLSLEGMLEAIGIDSNSSCTACWTGKYPTLIANGAGA